MRIRESLRIDRSAQIAFVGAGGKTTAIFQLARQFSPPVIVTASTHLGSWQLGMADEHYIVRQISDIRQFEYKLPAKVILVTGPEDKDQRMKGLTGESLFQLHQIAKANRIPMLIEADGSRQKPLKAPADHEPVVPTYVDLVVVVAGLVGLGKPLGPAAFHRTELYSALAGISIGDMVSVESIVKVLQSHQGGLQNIPDKVPRWLLLNQADDFTRQAAAARIAEQLKFTYAGVLISSLKHRPGKILARHEPVAAVILAAGSAQRFGAQKLLLEWEGQPVIRRIVRQALAAELNPVVVVAGDEFIDIRAAIADLPVEVIVNPEWKKGQSSSLQTGLRRVCDQSAGVIFLLGDQPQVSVGQLRALYELQSKEGAMICAPLIEDRRGNPVLFDLSVYPDLLRLSGDIGGRALFRRYPIKYLNWFERSMLYDIDTQTDLDRLRAMIYPEYEI